MSNNSRIESYLDAVTASLEGDPELKLDVRAELATHLDEADDQFKAEGKTPEESVEQAIKTLGPAVDYADELVAANRSRMRLRGRIRLLLRALVIPASIVAAAISLSGLLSARLFVGLVGNLDGFGGGSPAWMQTMETWMQARRERHLSPGQRLVLHGDPSRADASARERAIWEAWPTNVVYLNNFLSTVYAHYESLGKTDAERLAVLDRELETAMALDPTNARYHYVKATKLFEQGGGVEVVPLGKNEKGEERTEFRLTVTNRALVDRAMADFRVGLQKPVLRRYASDMLRERLDIMGPPQSLQQQIREVSVAAGVLLPDLSAYRNLTRASLGYARLLITEGRTDEARPFLDAWQTLSRQVAEDSFTLIDILVAAAIARIGQEQGVALYREMGDSAAAERTLQAATALYAPVSAYKARIKGMRDDGEQQRLLERKAGLLAALLLPALGETLSAEELAPSRLVEYVKLDQAVIGLVNIVLIAMMAACLLIVLRWRFIRGAGGAPLLLLPDSRQTLRIVGFGVLLPLLVYGVWTQLPWSRSDSLRVMFPMALAEGILLVFTVTGVTVTLAGRVIRKRCETLGVEVPPPAKGRLFVYRAAILGGLLLIVAQAHVAHSLPDVLFWIGFGVMTAALILTGFGVLLKYLFGSKPYGLYRGTVARSLIPYLALAAVLVTLLSNPYLRAAESRLIQGDTVMAMPSSQGAVGFTVIETRLTQRLRQQMLEAGHREP